MSPDSKTRYRNEFQMVVVTGKKLMLRLILRKQTEDTRDERGGWVVQIRLITHDISSLEHSKAGQ